MDRSFELEGAGPDGVVLVHGLGGAPAEMAYLAKRLHRSGFSVVVPQLAGHGEGEAELLRSRWQDWLGSVEAAADGLAGRVRCLHVAGICIGGALGVALAARSSRVHSVAAYSITFEYDGWNMPPWATAARMIDRVANWPGIRRIRVEEAPPFGLKDERLRRRLVERPEAFIEGAHMRLTFGALCQMYRLGRHVEQVAPRVRAPALIVHAAEDDMSHPRNALRLQRALGGPTRVQILDDCYHMIHIDRQRDEVARLTAAFFAAPAAGRAPRAVRTPPALDDLPVAEASVA